MPELNSSPRIGAPPESPHALQLQRGFPWLRFEGALEAEFRQVHRAEMLPQVRRNLWLAIAFVVGFSALTHLVLPGPVNQLLDLLRIATFGPVLIVGIAVVHSRLYQKWYPLTALLGAPIFGAGVAVISVLASQRGTNLIASVVLAIIYIYFMLGMTFYYALGAALAVFAAYLIAAVTASLPWSEVLVDAGVLVFANIIGAMVCYSLERATRTNFLEERLLIDAASRDGLTGIHNRRYFDEHLGRLWPQAIRERVPLALLLIDIDHFKSYNDYYGHQAGDECLRQVAWCLSRCARRPLDITARYGGEEFAIVLFDARRDYLEDTARRIHAGIAALAIAVPSTTAGQQHLTVSIGAACIDPGPNRSRFGFIQLADEALYAAKEQGRNRTVVMDKEYDELNTGNFRRGIAARASAGVR